ncbi:MAG: hypothetical protein NC350_03540 [Corallococcus sp.]|nr:hypothetical protein [Corallococcus sp.]
MSVLPLKTFFSEPPFKVYFVETRDDHVYAFAEFVCDEITSFYYGYMDYPLLTYGEKPYMCKVGNGYYVLDKDLERIGLTYDELFEYGKGESLTGLHVSELTVFDTPKRLFRLDNFTVVV